MEIRIKPCIVMLSLITILLLILGCQSPSSHGKYELPGVVSYDLKKALRLGNLVYELDLMGEKLDTFPNEFTNLRNLRSLSLVGCLNLDIEIVIGQLDSLDKLSELELSKCQLTSLPSKTSNLQKLERLDLSNNFLQDIPGSLGKLPYLKKLSLASNRLTELPSQLRESTFLEEIYLYDNDSIQIDNVIYVLTAIDSIKIIDLSFSRLHIIPPEIGNLIQVETLILAGNQIETFPKEIQNLKNLKHLWLGGNPISEEELARLEVLIPNTKINFNDRFGG